MEEDIDGNTVFGILAFYFVKRHLYSQRIKRIGMFSWKDRMENLPSEIRKCKFDGRKILLSG